MGLVDYASDDSDAEPDSNPRVKPSQPSKDAPFQKVVDKNHPNKIRVNLAGSSQAGAVDESHTSSEPDAKRIKLGSGIGRGINAFLPAPKRPAVAPSAGTSRPRGLAPGINLKTGAEPAFSREPMQMPSPTQPENDQDHTPPATTNNTSAPHSENENTEFKPKGKATRFMPLSVSRRPKPKPPSATKPKATPTHSGDTPMLDVDHAATIAGSAEDRKPTSRTRITLFSTALPEEVETASSTGHETVYEPMLYEQPSNSGSADLQRPRTEDPQQDQQGGGRGGTQSLDAIATDLNLTAAERRQLFGRTGTRKTGGAQEYSTNAATTGTAAAVNVVNFNADAEYAANEELRAAGEQPEQQARVVRSLNTAGKNSLRSLINVVNTQGDALEEHLAKGKRNRQEAGNKYGW